MIKIGRFFLAGVMLILAAAVTFLSQAAAQAAPQVAPQAAPDDSITLTGPAPNTTIAESDDYATQVLHDPWDMNNLDDLDQPFNLTGWGVNNGIWSGTTQGSAHTASVFLQYENFPEAYSYLGENDGQNKPIDAQRFNRMYVRMYSPVASFSVAYFFQGYGHTPTGGTGIIPTRAGWNIYSIDMRQNGSGWTTADPYEQLRFDPPSEGAGANVQIDWIRLTPDTATPVTVQWTAQGSGTVNLYLSLSPNASDDNELLIGTASATAGSFTWNTTGIAPGNYYIHAELNGAVSAIGPLNVNTAPLVRIDAPGPLTGEEYSYATTAESWDGSNPNQFDLVRNVSNLSFGSNGITGVPTSNDAQLIWLNNDNNHPIDAAKYHYFNAKYWLSAPSQEPYSQYNLGPRLLWNNGSGVSTTELLYSEYNRWIPAAIDLRQIQLLNNTPSNWGGSESLFRFDPAEDDDGHLPTNFMIQAAHLTSDPIAGRMGEASSNRFGTIIRWTTLQGTGTISLYRTGADQKDGIDGGTLIAQNLPIGQGQYIWDTSGVPAGNYRIYATAQDGTNNSTSTALVPITVSTSAPSTLFNDIPSTLWAVDYVNRLAGLGVIGGFAQQDTTVLFKPNNTATRGQLSKMLALATGWQLINPGTATFNDVPVGSTFFQYVETAADRGVISGYDCGGPGEPCPGRYFRPNNNVSRGQVSKMIQLAFQFADNTSGGPHFNDVPNGSTFYTNIETLFNLAIVGGYSDGSFKPGNSVTRAQVSKMLSLSLDASTRR